MRDFEHGTNAEVNSPEITTEKENENNKDSSLPCRGTHIQATKYHHVKTT